MKLLFLQGIGVTEWVLIVVVILLMFGGKKIPELMRGAGRGIREFKDAMNNPTKEEEEATEKYEKSEKTEEKK